MASGAVWTTDKGTFIRILVRPNSKENIFVSEVGSEYILVNLKGPARKGKANKELVKRLAKLLNISTSGIMLVAGHKNREKILLIEEISAHEIEQKLSS